MNWSQAFITQAQSDLAAYDELSKTSLRTCHRLHYLQMWLEKLCKAYLWAPHLGTEELRKRHQVVGNVLPRLVIEHWQRIGYVKKPDIGGIRALCREIDLLHPSIDDNGLRPDNVEYPWLKEGSVTTPAIEKFRLSERMNSRDGRLLFKAARRLTENPTLFLP